MTSARRDRFDVTVSAISLLSDHDEKGHISVLMRFFMSNTWKQESKRDVYKRSRPAHVFVVMRVSVLNSDQAQRLTTRFLIHTCKPFKLALDLHEPV
jgi:hypothetical protein